MHKQAMVFVPGRNELTIYGGITGTPNPSNEPPFSKELHVVGF